MLPTPRAAATFIVVRSPKLLRNKFRNATAGPESATDEAGEAAERDHAAVSGI